ncbi:diacylglycerol kinase family protein [Magnetospira sp. QH-2]|uniref:diacylglycerol/lipid kinase family protein n=1 Tax=Magnetospira sp. (strain QH-2) TaxID=1288970 RepID=UPI0003E81727|nr:diacylglycerol kinase family protein [Magnetospira sp. QH-2]CCQ74665.1 putative diacylglycerol kinase [Magnetospira sp. QH-2]
MIDPYQKTTTRRILVIHNPIAGKRHGGLFQRVIDKLRDFGCMLTIRDTTRRGDAETFASEASADQFDALVAAGGDGTINEVINGLDDFRLPLAIVPLGTTNVLAREIGLAVQADAIARTIAEGNPTPIHVGLANDRRFIQMAGIGFDAQVVAQVNPSIKKLIGKGAYVVETFAQLVKYSFPRYRLTLDGKPEEAASAVISNGRYYGGKFVCTPDARLENGDFQVCLFRNSGRWNTLRYAWGLVTGRLGGYRDVVIMTAREITVEGPVGDPVQGDGDVLGHLPITLSLEPRRLTLLTP